MTKYEKPKMIFKDMRASEDVAATCWGLSDGHQQQKRLLFDIEGSAYLSFLVKSADGSCSSPDAYSIRYHANKSDIQGSELMNPEKYDRIIEEMLIAYSGRNGNGNNNENYANLEKDFPIKPDPSWS